MSQQNRGLQIASRVAVLSLGGLMAISFIPQCGAMKQMRTVAGYYECVRPAGVRESITISGYGWLAWSSGNKETARYQFELKGSEKFRMATSDSKGEPTLWKEYVYSRQGDELWFTPGLPNAGCERWISRKAPTKPDAKDMPDPLDLDR